jgi:hypothetical protein
MAGYGRMLSAGFLGRGWLRRRSSARIWTRDEIVAFIETEAWRRRGMSAAQLLHSYRDGSLESPGEVSDILALADLLPEDDPVFEAA